MADKNPRKRLEIKKGQDWELWLVSPSVPSVKTILGAFPTLEALNQAQITLYNAWEKPRLPREVLPSTIRH
ncbi:MAG: hypothetical protein WBB69_06655 [Anaerolineales bacterium]